MGSWNDVYAGDDKAFAETSSALRAASVRAVEEASCGAPQSSSLVRAP
jgi:hypothetical protein